MSREGEPSQRFEKRVVVPALAAVARAHGPEHLINSRGLPARGQAGKPLRQEVRTWATTRGLEELRDWLKAEKLTHVGMESTGACWRPIYAVLEGQFALIVGNARHIRNVPGRKTDVKDANWIADLVRHGLIRPTLCAASAPARVA